MKGQIVKISLRLLVAFLVLGFAQLFALPVLGQPRPTISVYGAHHYNVRSYQGLKLEQVGTHTIHIQLPSPGINIEKWSITAKIETPMISRPANVSGLTFPENRIKLRFLNENFDSNTPRPQPTLRNLGVPLVGIPMQVAGSETYIIDRAVVPLRTGNIHYLNLRYHFGFDIEGGLYLDQLLSDNGGNPWNTNPAQYLSPVTFTLLDEFGTAIAKTTFNMNIQIHRPLGEPPQPEYSLQLIGDARDGQLNFLDLRSYVEGAQATYSNGVRVQSKTGFQVQVKALQSELVNAQGRGLPVDLLRISLSPGLDAVIPASFPEIRLSTEAQTILQAPNGSSKAQFYDLRYSTGRDDPRVLNVSAGTYSTLLVYQLIPQ